MTTARNGYEEKSILVLGGTGKTGRRVVERLTARGLPVRVGSRSGRPPFDWDDQSTWGPALFGADRMYISYYPDLAVPGAVESICLLTALAAEMGVRRLVLLSGRGDKEAQRAEEVVRGSSAAWTILRCSWFNQNFSENYLLDPLLAGEVVLPAGGVREPFVDADDIADAAVAALTEDGHAGRLYELTGPRLLTFAEAIEEIARASGREIRYRQVTPREYASMLEDQDVPEDFIRLLDYLFTTDLDGRNAYVTDGVRQALGRTPLDFSDYARQATSTGVWDGESRLDRHP